MKKYKCSEENQANKGKWYYACMDRYCNSAESCNFFVWEHELEYECYITCHCGILCKKINTCKEGFLTVYKSVSIMGTNTIKDAIFI